MRSVRGLASLALLVLAGACDGGRPAPGRAAGTPAAPEGALTRPPIVLGLVTSLAASEVGLGESVGRGVRLAVEEQNARGGIRDRRITVKTADDQGRAEDLALAGTRLATEEHASVLLAAISAPRVLALLPVADRHLVALVVPASTDPKVTRTGERIRPFVFRTCAGDPAQGTAMARFARETLAVKQVAILRDVASDTSVAQADAFLTTFKELGGDVVDDQGYRSGDQDLRPQLTAIRRRKPGAVYVPGAAAEVALAARQVRDLGLPVQLLGGDGWDAAKLPEAARGALEGAHFSAHWSPDDPGARAVAFVKAYQAQHGTAPDAPAALGYDAARVVLEAMARAPDLSRTAIRDAIAAVRGFPGVTGDITMDAGHGAVKPVAILKIQGDRATFARSSQP